MSPAEGVPSLAGAMLLTICALLVTLVAVGAIALWNPNNAPGSLIVDVICILVAFWVDSRAVHTWRRLSASHSRNPS